MDNYLITNDADDTIILISGENLTVAIENSWNRLLKTNNCYAMNQLIIKKSKLN